MIDKFFRGLEAHAAFLERNAAVHEAAMEVLSETSAHLMREKIRDVMGDQAKLAPLAQATQDSRARAGYTPDDPLLASGSLRDSWEVAHAPLMAAAGTDDERQVFHEFGYINHRTGNPVPARPAVDIGMAEAQPEIMALATEVAGIGLGFGQGIRKVLPT